MLRRKVLACLLLSLAGCGFGKKDKANAPKSAAEGGLSGPTYEWKRPPDDLQRPPVPAKKPGETDPF